MESRIFKEEINKLEFRRIKDSDITTKIEKAYSNRELKDLNSYFERPFGAYIKSLADCTPTPISEIDDIRIINFLKANKLFKDLMNDNEDLIESYSKEVEEQRALPLIPLEEISNIITVAFLSGTFSTLASILISKIFRGKNYSKKDLEKALDLLLSNSILPLFEKYRKGLTAEEIAGKLDMKLADVGYFLANFEAQGWIKSEVKDKTKNWKIKKSRAEIIKEFIGRKWK